MKTFREFVEVIEQTIPSKPKGDAIRYRGGGGRSMQVITTHPATSVVYGRELERAAARRSMPGYIGTGIAAGMGLAKLATQVAQRNRETQQQRLNSMVPGNTSVSGKPAKIIKKPDVISGLGYEVRGNKFIVK